MVFKRRDRPPIWNRLREMFYPRKGWRRGFLYLNHRMKRIPDTPHRIALGFAAGAFVSFSPFFGFHFVYAALIAFIFRGNIVAGLIGTVVGNPLTFPAIAVGSLGLGRWLLGGSAAVADFAEVKDAFALAFDGLWLSARSVFGTGESALGELSGFLREVFLPYLVGGIFTGLACAVATYFLCRPVVAAYQARRRAKLVERARQRVREGMSRVAARSEPAE